RMLIRPAAAAPPSRADIPPPPVAASPDHMQAFVFFPQSPDPIAPMYRDLPEQFHAADFHRPDSTARLRLTTPISTAMTRNVLAFVREAQGLARAGARRIGVTGLTIRYSMAASPARVWTVGLIGAGALAIGFLTVS